MRSREAWAACKEEACRSEDAAREGREVFEKNTKLLEKGDMEEEETRMIADKMW